MSEQNQKVTLEFELSRPEEISEEAWTDAVRQLKEGKPVHWQVSHGTGETVTSNVRFSGPIGLAPAFVHTPDGEIRLVEVSLVPYKPGDERYGVHPVEIIPEPKR